jgi:hypothetical protein
MIFARTTSTGLRLRQKSPMDAAGIAMHCLWSGVALWVVTNQSGD